MITTTNAWGTGPDGKELKLFTFQNSHGTSVSVTNYGAIITSIRTIDASGVFSEIALGFDRAADYLSDNYIANCPYFGCIAGRYANRIAKGRFTLEGNTYTLAVNNGGNALHGGIRGFDKQVWDGQMIETPEGKGVELSYLSQHLEEGYPGNLKVTVKYVLSEKNELLISFKATTDQTTILNLTNHTYFNLSSCRENILGHRLLVNSSRQIESLNLIPTGNIQDITGSVFDFSREKTIGRDIDGLPDGYDTGFALGSEAGSLTFAARLSEETSGRKVEVFTDQPAVHVYTGYYIPEVKGHAGVSYGRYMGVALETQHYPDSPNHPHFPSTRLKPGETFESTTIFRFGLI